MVTEAKIPYVIFNGATSFIVDKSPYLVRVGFTIWQPNVPIGEYAVDAWLQEGDDDRRRLRAGRGHGRRLQLRLREGRRQGRRRHQGAARHQRFSSYMQRIKDSKPECVFPFMPGGPMALNFVKGFAEMGFTKQGVDRL